MKRPPLPYLLLGAMTLVSFGGPFAVLLVLRGGTSPTWPPDRPVEWITTAVVVALAGVLFLTCISIRLWYPLPPHSSEPRETRSA
jgi:hypothetical protein